MGSLADIADGYLLTVEVRSASDGAMLFVKEQPFTHSHLLDSLAVTDADTSNFAPRAGRLTSPICSYCPQPMVPAQAKKTHFSRATVLLTVVVTTEGRASNMQVLKDPGWGFAERAVEAVSEWKFKPALDKDRKPLAVTVRIEVTFHD